MVRRVREFLLFAREHGGYTFGQALDLYLAAVGARESIKPRQIQQYEMGVPCGGRRAARRAGIAKHATPHTPRQRFAAHLSRRRPIRTTRSP